MAESFTGGRILDALTDAPGASRVLRGGVVAYADDAKARVLDVPRGALLRFGAVSRPVALEMAASVRRRFDADYGLATTGIAGPTGATAAKPLGLSFAAAAGAGPAFATERVHPGGRADVKAAAAAQAVDVLAELLRHEGIL